MSKKANKPPDRKHRIQQQHDKTYKLFYSFPEMVEDTMRLIPEDWVDELDFSTLERMAENRVTERLDMRIQDVVWKVRYKGTDIYLCLLIEFQSTIDPYMILRTLFYWSAFYADLVRQLQDKATPDPLLHYVEDENGHRYAQFPLAIPIVCYNGKPIWWPTLSLLGIIRVPPGLEHLVPDFSYILLDEHRIPEERLEAENLLAALIGLEKSDSVEGLYEGYKKVLEWEKKPGLRNAFAAFVKKSLIHIGLIDEAQDVSDPEEIKNMLAENLMEWRERVRNEGRNEGREEGLEKGREEGQLAGEALILTRQIQLKFGPLDEATEKRIAEADSETLLRWADRVLTAEKLSDVFKED